MGILSDCRALSCFGSREFEDDDDDGGGGGGEEEEEEGEGDVGGSNGRA